MKSTIYPSLIFFSVLSSHGPILPPRQDSNNTNNPLSKTHQGTITGYAGNCGANGIIAEAIGSAPIVVMADDACAGDPNDPTGSCNTSFDQSKDWWGSDTAVDLCGNTGAADALFGRRYGDRAGMAVGDLTQVDCGRRREGSADPASSVATPGRQLSVGKKS